MSSAEMIKTEDNDGKVRVEIINLQNELLYSYYMNNYQNILVIPNSLMEEKYLTNYNEIFEKYRGIVKVIDEDISVVS